jgi:hypothetical protein
MLDATVLSEEWYSWNPIKISNKKHMGNAAFM